MKFHSGTSPALEILRVMLLSSVLSRAPENVLHRINKRSLAFLAKIEQNLGDVLVGHPETDAHLSCNLFVRIKIFGRCFISLRNFIY